MKYKVNAYFASLLITIVGAWAALTIIHVAYANTFVVTKSYSGSTR